LTVSYNGINPISLSLHGSNHLVQVKPPHIGSAVFKLNDSGVIASKTVRVVPEPKIHSFTITPPSVQPGTQVTLNAVFTGGNGYLRGYSSMVTSGSPVIFTALHSDTFTLTVTNGAGISDTGTATLTVVPAPLPPILIAQPQLTKFESNHKQIIQGEEVELTIQYTDGTARLTAYPVMQMPNLSPGNPNVIKFKPNVTTTYTLNVTNNGTTLQKSIEVEVCTMDFQFPPDVTQIGNTNNRHV